MSGLVIAEHDHKTLSSGTLSTVTAALKLNESVDMLVVGHQCDQAAQAASQLPQVDKVYYADAPHLEYHLAENVAPIVAHVGKNYDYIMMAATTYGKNILPRAAAVLDAPQISDITDIVSGDTFVRPIYAGNALATVQSNEPIKLITVRTTAFDPVSQEGGQASIESVDPGEDSRLSEFLSAEISQSDRPDLTTARVIISGGRGMGSKENFEMLKQIADKLNAAIGASRAAVDAGYVPNDYQVGQTGKSVAPDLYIAVGISGAIQHLAGMRDSKIIVAINKDPDAPIFNVADYGLVGDLFEVLPKLNDSLDQVLEQDNVSSA